MLVVRAFAGLAFLLGMIGTTLFLAAGEVRYWQAWTFLAVFGISVLAITLYLVARDRALLERRVAAGPLAEQQASQKLIQWAAGIAFMAPLRSHPANESSLQAPMGWSGIRCIRARSSC